MSARISLARDEVDRLVLMRMDVDRYEAQVIPALNAHINELSLALEVMLAAVADASPANVQEGVKRARRVLER